MPGEQAIETSDPVRPSVVAPEAVREQILRVLDDPLFRNSPRSGDLLKFIVDHTLKGQKEDLKERMIGIEVFGRTPDYDSGNDSRVRVAANELRKRLAGYYSKAEHQQELRIEVPVRSYVAKFSFPELPPVEAEAPLPKQNLVEAAPKKTQLSRHVYMWSSATIVLALAVWLTVRLLFPVPIVDRFWAPVMSGPGPLSIFIGRPVDANGISPTSKPSTDSHAPEIPDYDPNQLVQVRTTDTSAAENLAAYLRRKGKDSLVRPTQGTELADLRSESAVIYGRFLNEWAARLWSNLHFRFSENSAPDIRWIEDTSNPANRNWSVNMSAPDRIDSDYALITRVQDPTSGRWWIGIAGLTGPGTFAASQIAIDPNAMSTIGARLPRGWEQKNLQIVIEIKLAQGSSGATRVVATYTW